MPNFYFVDSNIIMGYCNPKDYLYDVAKAFFNEKHSRQMFLLFSVREEFIRKIEDERTFFFTEFIRPINTMDFPKLQRIIQKAQSNPKYQNNKFLEYILSLFKNRNITHVSYTDLQEVFSEYNKNLKKEFDTLTQNWIKRPYMKNHTTIFQDRIYLNYYNNLRKVSIHFYDAKHLALAGYEVRARNRRNREHQYFFYTDDRGILNKNLGSIIKLPNFFIKKIPYKEDYRLRRDPKTGRNTIKIIDRRIYEPNGL